MGNALKLINPTVRFRVDRNFLQLFTRELAKVVNKLEKPYEQPKTGRKGHNPRTVAVMWFLKEALCHTYDSLDSEIRHNEIVKAKLKVKQLPSRSAVHRGAQKLSQQYIRKLNKQLTLQFRRKRITIVADSTGFTLQSSSTWYDIRIKRENRKKKHDKLHIIGCVDTGIVLDYRITDGRRHDSPLFKQLVKELSKIAKAIGDPAYLSRLNCELVVQKGGKPYFLPKKNCRTRARGSSAYRTMITFFKKAKDVWIDIYHQRSIVEGIFSSLKRRFKSWLVARKKRMQRKELSAKVIAYNIRRILYIKEAKKLGISLWVKK